MIEKYLSRTHNQWTLTYHRNNYTTVFIDNLVMITRKWNQPKCLCQDEYIMKMWYIVKNMEISS